MCAYPDLLLHVYYNYIMDIDLESGLYEWVKYRGENQINTNGNLSMLFLNCGFYTSDNHKYKELSVDDIRQRVND